jgi:acylglycerol lipase
MNEYNLKSVNGNINIIEDNNENFNAIILNLHGVGSCFQSVDSTFPNDIMFRINYFNKINYKVFAMEFQGHGKSQGERTRINDMNELLLDIDNTVNHIKNKYPNSPIYILAESMGGGLAIKYSILYRKIDKLLLLSPFIGIYEERQPNPCISYLLCLISLLFPGFRYGSKVNSCLYELDYEHKLINSNFYNIEPLQLCTLRELYNLSLWICKYGHELNIPFLIIHGHMDNVVSVRQSQSIFYKCNYKNKKLIIYDNMWHCLLTLKTKDDTDPYKVYEDIKSFL